MHSVCIYVPVRWHLSRERCGDPLRGGEQVFRAKLSVYFGRPTRPLLREGAGSLFQPPRLPLGSRACADNGEASCECTTGEGRNRGKCFGEKAGGGVTSRSGAAVWRTFSEAGQRKYFGR